MNKKKILNEFKKVNINSTSDLYEFLMENDEAIINGKKYNLINSKDVVILFYIFVSALGLNSVILNFQKDCFEHWFLAFKEDNEWYYYETVLKDIAGQFSFLNYDELIFFVSKKLNSYSGSEEDKYVLKDFKDGDDIKSEGVELLVADNLNLHSDSGFSFIPGKVSISSNNGLKLFLCGFGLTAAFSMILLGIAVYIMQNH